MSHSESKAEAQCSGGQDEQTTGAVRMIEVICTDLRNKKVRLECRPLHTIKDLKTMIEAQTGTRSRKIVLKRWGVLLEDHVTLSDYNFRDCTKLELYYK